MQACTFTWTNGDYNKCIIHLLYFFSEYEEMLYCLNIVLDNCHAKQDKKTQRNLEHLQLQLDEIERIVSPQCDPTQSTKPGHRPKPSEKSVPLYAYVRPQATSPTTDNEGDGNDQRIPKTRKEKHHNKKNPKRRGHHKGSRKRGRKRGKHRKTVGLNSTAFVSKFISTYNQSIRSTKRVFPGLVINSNTTNILEDRKFTTLKIYTEKTITDGPLFPKKQPGIITTEKPLTTTQTIQKEETTISLLAVPVAMTTPTQANLTNKQDAPQEAVKSSHPTYTESKQTQTTDQYRQNQANTNCIDIYKFTNLFLVLYCFL